MKAGRCVGVALLATLSACSGRPTSGGNTTPPCEADLQPGDLVITEVMADPADSDEGREWFEVFNAGGRDLDLAGVSISLSKPDGSNEKRMVLGAMALPAGSYFVFGSAMPAAAPAYVDYPYASALGAMPNSGGGRLAIFCGDVLVDEVVYPPAPGAASWSLDGSRSPDAARNDDPGAWCAATTEYDPSNKGSPGGPNEACLGNIPAGSCWDGTTVRPLRVPALGDLVISEFLAKPKAVSYTSGEWVEVAVLADVDVNGLGLGKTVDALKEVIPAGTCREASAGSFLVFVRKTDPAVNGGIEAAAGALPFGLTDTGTNQLVLAVGGQVLDEVTYETPWVKPGTSIALDSGRLDPGHNDDLANWCFATTPYGAGDLGTPGAANPTCP